MHNDPERLRAAYETAMQALSPLPRAVFLLCRLDDLSYTDIGKRLSIAPAVVEECIALTLFSFSVLWRGRSPDRSMPPMIIEAEAALFQEYRADCARVIVATVHALPETSNKAGGRQRDRDIIPFLQRCILRIRNWLMRSRWRNCKPRTLRKAMTFDEWLRNRTDSENRHHDPCHSGTLV